MVWRLGIPIKSLVYILMAQVGFASPDKQASRWFVLSVIIIIKNIKLLWLVCSWCGEYILWEMVNMKTKK